MNEIRTVSLLFPPARAGRHIGQLIDAVGQPGRLMPANEQFIIPIEPDVPDVPFDLRDGVAVIKIRDVMFDDDVVMPTFGWSGYGGLIMQFEAALASPSVSSILFDIGSPGGFSGPGLNALVDRIMAARGEGKPIVAAVRTVALSAAYRIAAAAEAVFVPRGGEVGSVGVWTAHIDLSQWLESEGIVVSLIFAGAHKVDGNPWQALPDDVRAEIQAEIDEIRADFAADVARGRDMQVQAVLDTEARIYRDDAAVEIGFADGIATRDEVLAAMIADTGTV